MSKKFVINPNVIQKFKWGGTNLEWEEEAEKLANQLETADFINAQHDTDLETPGFDHQNQ